MNVRFYSVLNLNACLRHSLSLFAGKMAYFRQCYLRLNSSAVRAIKEAFYTKIFTSILLKTVQTLQNICVRKSAILPLNFQKINWIYT